MICRGLNKTGTKWFALFLLLAVVLIGSTIPAKAAEVGSGALTFSDSDYNGELNGTNTSISRQAGEKTFTLSGGIDGAGLSYYMGIYAWDVTESKYKVTITIEPDYMFNLDSLYARSESSGQSFQIDYTCANQESGSITVSGLATGSLWLHTVSIANVTQVVLSSSVQVVYNNIELSNIKEIPEVPAISEVSADNITTESATLKGSVNAQGDSTKVIFEYGTDVGYGSSTDEVQPLLTSTDSTAVSKTITGLKPNTTYYYQVKATNAAGTIYGDGMSFTTKSIPISDFIDTTTTKTTASFSWTQAIGASSIIIQQSPQGDNNWTTAITENPIAATDTSTTVTGLEVGSVYDFRLLVTGGDNEGNSNTHTVMTASTPVSDFAGTVTSFMKADFTWTAVTGASKIAIEQSPAGQNSWTTANTGAIDSTATSATVSDLATGTAYDFRLVVTKGENAGESNLVTLTTDPQPAGELLYIGAQKRTNTDSTVDIRLIGIIKTLEAEEVGFVYSVSDTTPECGETECIALSTKKVYTSIKVAGAPRVAGEFGGAGSYFFVNTVKDINQLSTGTLYVRGYMKKSDGITYTEVRQIILSSLM